MQNRMLVWLRIPIRKLPNESPDDKFGMLDVCGMD